MKIHDSVETLERLYPETPDIHVVPLAGKAGSHVNVYRYDDLGIGFEVQAGKIAAITLYPLRAAKQDQ